MRRMTEPNDSTMIDWQIRVPEPDQLEDFARPVQLAFGGGLSAEELADWLKRAQPDRWLGAFEPESDVVAGLLGAR